MVMKAIFLILVCLLCKSVSAQTIPVFQVVHAENASLNNGTALKSLDKLLDETIHVADSGYLVLIHETGIPIEFNGDTTIHLKEIHTILDPPLSKKTKRYIARSKTPYFRHSYQRSIGLHYLFISNEIEARNTRPVQRPCHDCGPPNSGLRYPPLIDNKLFYSDTDLKLMWLPREETDRFILRFVNIYDDELCSPFAVDDRQYTLSRDKIADLTKSEPDILLLIKGIESFSVDEFVIIMSPFYTAMIDFPYSSNITSPAVALMAGHIFETTSIAVSKEARPYYELAARLSDKKFYQDMLENYYARQGR
jgi:hypothetical protein